LTVPFSFTNATPFASASKIENLHNVPDREKKVVALPAR
jgi:hypothetical protein